MVVTNEQLRAMTKLVAETYPDLLDTISSGEASLLQVKIQEYITRGVRPSPTEFEKLGIEMVQHEQAQILAFLQSPEVSPTLSQALGEILGGVEQLTKEVLEELASEVHTLSVMSFLHERANEVKKKRNKPRK